MNVYDDVEPDAERLVVRLRAEVQRLERELAEARKQLFERNENIRDLAPHTSTTRSALAYAKRKIHECDAACEQRDKLVSILSALSGRRNGVRCWCGTHDDSKHMDYCEHAREALAALAKEQG